MEIEIVFVTLDEDEAAEVSVSQSLLPQFPDLPLPANHLGSVLPRTLTVLLKINSEFLTK